MNKGLTSVSERGSSVKNGLLTGEQKWAKSCSRSLWQPWPQWRWNVSLNWPHSSVNQFPPPLGATAPLAYGSLPGIAMGGGAIGLPPPIGGGGAWSGACILATVRG